MKRFIKWAAILAIVIFVPIQFVRPSRTNPAADPKLAIEMELQIPPDVSATLHRACGDCHSDGTHWPWYSEVAPTSWFVADHVNSGRRHINFSNWVRPGKEPKDSEDRLTAICREVKSGAMPLSSYLLIHWSSKLSEGDKTQICAWTDEEIKRLMAGSTNPAGN
ncbi:MAG TPA: heme-binding domain-containing protein [Candidatus Acidoferrales bacterium]|nr:heme-binding domain-containing protein [Candidatus Acidoferrales bacterium]